jgi:hypothetical protein
MKIINCNEARQISIVDYLAQCGFHPQYIKGFNHWYLSPIREEKAASFKVNTKLNSWYDHGIGKGGNLIDLGIRLHHCTVKELLNKLCDENYSLSFHQPVKSDRQNEPENKIIIHNVGALNNIGLVSYLHEREIDYYIAKAWCKEVLFTVNNKPHLAIGFANQSGGYELRNASLKLSSSPKDLTFIDNGYDSVYVFEGFMDMLSLLMIKQENMPANFLVLNSMSFVNKSLEYLRQQQSVFVYPDHDISGQEVMKIIKKAFPRAVDGGSFYEDFKDLNEYLVTSKQTLSRGFSR